MKQPIPDPNATPMMLEGWLLQNTRRVQGRWRTFLRVALSQYVANGLTVSLGLVLIMLAIFETAGLASASVAAVGIMITSLPDLPAPRRRKIMQILPAPLLGAPLSVLVQLTRHDELLLGIVLVAGTFLAVMMMAWGKRGGPICFSLIFSMLFLMAAPPTESLEEIARHCAWYLTGAGFYLLWAVFTTHLLNRRFRAQMLADCLAAFAKILRTQGQRFGPQPDHQALLSSMLQQQAALADHLQNTRDVVLESPTTLPRQRMAAMLLSLLEARDHQLACDLDLDYLLNHSASATTLPALQGALETMADQLDDLSFDLLLGRRGHAIDQMEDLRARLSQQLPPGMAPLPAADSLVPDPLLTHTPDATLLLHNMIDRIGHLSDETIKLTALARGDVMPELSAVRTQWQLFVSTTRWSWKPLLGQLTWRAPTLRYALRATLAVAAAYVISLHLPWVAHEYWILLTVVVVMRGNLAQTVERRNARVAGTLLGCGLVMLILSLHPSARAIFLVVALSMGLAHAFALRRYLYTSIAGTLAGLLQAHLLLAGIQPTFAIGERLADTLLGASIAWGFSYVLPAWERSQMPALLRRTVEAQLRHARLALALGKTEQTTDVDWRLARRDAYNSLSDLTLATQRTLAEPSKVRMPLEPLEALQARSYQLLAQLTAVKSMLLLRRGQLDMAVSVPALDECGRQIAAELSGKPAAAASATSTAGESPEPDTPPISGQPFQHRPDPLAVADLTPWLLRRLTLATAMAREFRTAVTRVRL